MHFLLLLFTNGGDVGVVVTLVAETMHDASFANVGVAENKHFVRCGEVQRHFGTVHCAPRLVTPPPPLGTAGMERDSCEGCISILHRMRSFHDLRSYSLVAFLRLMFRATLHHCLF